MRILIDIGHPAHVHYFKNFILEMKNRGHEFLITARDKDVAHKLLNDYNIPYVSKGKGSSNLLGKLFFLLKSNFIIFKHALKFKPDLFMGFASPYASQVSWIMRKPSIILNDTEHKSIAFWAYEPFARTILSPTCFMKPFSKKQIFFNSYMELAALHPKYFTPDHSVLAKYNIQPSEVFFILRFVAWGANHDIGQKGFSTELKSKIINKLKKYGKVIISSETKLPEEFQKFYTEIEPIDLHHLLSFASLYVGEGSTTASESAVLGTPAIFVNSLKLGYCKEQQEKYDICFQSINENEIINRIDQHIANDFLKDRYVKVKNQIIEDKIDIIEFLVSFVENYPKSITEMNSCNKSKCVNGYSNNNNVTV